MDTTTEPLSHGDVTEELKFLATVEHALVVEHLTLGCALGHDVATTPPDVTAAAGAANQLAQTDMIRFRDLARGLAATGEAVDTTRATSLPAGTGPGADIGLDPPGGPDPEQMLTRGLAIATAVDDRYRALQPLVTTGDLATVVAEGTTHADSFRAVVDALGSVTPADAIRITRREPADAFEELLLGVSDKLYGLVVAALRDQLSFADSFAGSSFRQLAVSAMFGLDEANRALVHRGLLPTFVA